MLKQYSHFFHPFTIALYPPLALYFANHDMVLLTDTFFPVALILAATLVAYFLLANIFRDVGRGALATSFLLLLFFAYGHIYSAANIHFAAIDKPIRIAFWGIFHPYKTALHFTLLVIYAVLFWVFIRWLRNHKGSLARVHEFINRFSLILLALLVAGWLFGNYVESSQGVKSESVEVGNSTEAITGTAKNLSYLPDIYYIIMDGYARADTLKEFYDYDNSEFINDLTGMGFKVIPDSFANFKWTYLSLSSSLNMKLVTDFAETIGVNSARRTIPYRMIRDNGVARFLKRFGYQFVHYTSTWGATEKNPYADRVVECEQKVGRSEYSRVLAESSMLILGESEMGYTMAECHRQQLENLRHAALIKTPKFVFAHFVIPHHPYLFGRDGELLSQADLSSHKAAHRKQWKNKKGYLDQLIFISNTMKGIIENILKESENPPIILLVSDHGPQGVFTTGLHSQLTRQKNFLAFLTPGKPNIYPDRVTSVNTFRILFRNYFQADLPDLPNEVYDSTYKKPYKFSPVPIGWN